MGDAFDFLPRFNWRGGVYPISARRVGFRHEGAPHKLQYRDGEFLEQTGASALTLTYTLAMREGVAKGPYKNLFIAGLPVLIRDCLDRTTGRLCDPVYGWMNAKPTSFDDSVDVARRDGVDVEVSFQRQPASEDELTPAIQGVTISGVFNDGAALDGIVAKASWAQEPSPEPSMDVLNAVNGFGAQVLANVDRIGAKLADYSLKLEKIEDTADKAENPDNWMIRDEARRLREAVGRLRNRVAQPPGKKMKAFALKMHKAVSALASESGMTVQELLLMNPGLSSSPLVKAGTVVAVTA